MRVSEINTRNLEEQQELLAANAAFQILTNFPKLITIVINNIIRVIIKLEEKNVKEVIKLQASQNGLNR